MRQKRPVSVLVAPLDWGIGHATRCIPIIKELILQEARVTIAANTSQKMLLKKEFPLLEFLEIPGYGISYRPGLFLKLGLFFRIPAICRQIKRENKWLDKILQNHQMDAVISDNRYGLFHKNLFCVFITHQLNIQSGYGTSDSVGRWSSIVGPWIDRKILKWNYAFIEKFSACWIPDFEGSFSIAGKLSHPPIPPSVPLKYIGILSRFQESEKKIVKNSLLILLSGPEPQRTLFENILLRQLADSAIHSIVVRGLPGSELPIPVIREGIKIYNHLLSDELNNLINESGFIIARSGYSTIMDLVKLKKNAILVPTPGQTEQEYLGHYLHEKKWMYCVSQKNFRLEKALTMFQKEKLVLPYVPDSNLQQVVEDFLSEISLGFKP
jgi:UDP-N-acetylglucosamine transferase subunit ALG13